MPPKLPQLGGSVISDIASFAYIFLLLLPFVIRPFAQLFHITANYEDSLVIQGLVRLVLSISLGSLRINSQLLGN